MITLALSGFAFSGLCGLYRLLKGPDLADRIIALDLLLIGLMGSIVVDAVRSGQTTYLMVPVVLAIIGFTTTVAGARFIEQPGRSERERRS